MRTRQSHRPGPDATGRRRYDDLQSGSHGSDRRAAGRLLPPRTSRPVHSRPRFPPTQCRRRRARGYCILHQGHEVGWRDHSAPCPHLGGLRTRRDGRQGRVLLTSDDERRGATLSVRAPPLVATFSQKCDTAPMKRHLPIAHDNRSRSARGCVRRSLVPLHRSLRAPRVFAR